MSELELLVKIRENAARKKRTILLPESHDERVLKATEIITREGIGKCNYSRK
jgi:phosphate acetyltransferase